MTTQKTYTGVWPLTMARTTLGSYVQIMAGDPVPDGLVAPDDLTRLVGEGAIGVLEVEVQDGPEPEPEAEFDPTKGGGVKETLAYVGDDKDRAASMLDLEEKRDTPRVTLVEKLEAIATEPNRS